MNLNTYRWRSILWILVSVYTLSNAQQNGVEMLTTRDGLSQGFISCMLQDHEGFIWIGTKNGLNRYDGYRFEVFTNDPYDEHTLSNDFINSLSEYGDFLLVGLEVGGLNIFHKKTRRVYRVPNSIFPGQAQGDLNIQSADVDAEGNIWVVAPVQLPAVAFGLFKITLPPGFWQNPGQSGWQQGLKLQYWPEVTSKGIGFSPDRQIIYTCFHDSIFQENLHSGSQMLIARIGHADIADFHIDPRGNIFISAQKFGQETSLFRLKPDAPASQVERVAVPPDFFTIHHIGKDWIWFDCRGKIRVYPLDQSGNFDLSRPEIEPLRIPVGHSSGVTDRSGITWIGLNGLGLMKINLRSKHFRHLFPGNSIFGSVMKDRYGNICTYNNLPELLVSTEFARGPVLPFLPDYKFFRSMALQDPGGTYWLTSIEAPTMVLQQYDPAGRHRVFNPPKPLFAPGCAPLALDRQQHPWIAYAGHLLHFDPATEQFSSFEYSRVQPEPENMMALAQTADGTWWIATTKGLLQGKPNGQNFDFQLLKNDPAQRNSLRNNNVATLLTDPKDSFILWIGTKGGGLDRLDVRTGQFTNLGLRNGLPNEVIYGILNDADGNLWMSSNKGLIRYTPSSGLIKNYTEEDGVQANEFNTLAYGKGPDGSLLFGGINGLNMFDPQDLKAESLPPLVQINGLIVNDADLSRDDTTGILSQAIEFTRAITVPYSRNNITLEFVALDFASPAKNRFRYYLEGAEEPWSHKSTGHSAPYLNLAPGTYTFKVKGANSEGVWNDTPVELKITVLPPWYRSWWAWLLYVIVIGGSTYLFLRYQLRSKLEHAENQRLKDLDSFKSRFFTNVTHEFRTPLTVILGMTERLDEINANGGGRETRTSTSAATALIRRNGANLLRLINQILDLAKLESNSLKINYIQGDVLAYLRYIAESLYSLANVKNVQLRVESDQAAIIMDYDPERLLQIVHNLLSNAIKFTPSGGRVVLTARKTMAGPQATFLLTVTDTGAGIPAADLPHVFDRFYQGANQSEAKAGGTGIGLSLTRELVKALNGEISANSVPGERTTFSVRLPLTNLATLENKTPGYGPPTLETQSGAVLPAVKSNPALVSELPQLLIVEDNPDVVEYLAGYLSESYRLDFAYNGRAGIEKAMESVPDIIISDVMMPEKDGFEVCETLKNDERTSHIPIVLLTARATMEDRIAGLRRGADAYLAKPFNREELLITLANLVALRARLLSRYAGPDLPPPSDEKGLQIEDAFLQKFRTVVETHMADAEFEMPQLERALAMSRSQIFRKIKALTGKSPTALIRSIRLARAKELLANTRLTAAEIAYDTGFSSPQYFSDAFFEEFGVRPGATRN